MEQRAPGGDSAVPNGTGRLYPRRRFLAEIIGRAVWLYHVFGRSSRNVELILAERGVTVTHETILIWINASVCRPG